MTQDKIEFEVAFDSETYYIKGAYSVAGKNGLTNRQYVTDERFNCYLVSFAIEKKVADAYGVDVSTWDHVPFKNLNGIEVDLYATACHPSKMNWKQFDNATFVIHNAAFDCNVLDRLFELGIVENFSYRAVDTADLVAYLGVKRNLKSACKILLGLEVSKEVRSDMDSKLPEYLTPSERLALYKYGIDDAIHAYMLWSNFAKDWPYVERRMSELNRISNIRGLEVNVDAIEEGLEKLRKIKSSAEARLPWMNAENPEDRYPAASLPALAKWLGEHGYQIPKSFNKNGNEFLDWRKTLDEERDTELIDILNARIAVTGTNPHIARLETMLAQLDGTKLHPGFVYFGAHTGRFTAGLSEEADGAKNVNLLNMTKKPVYGVDMRSMYIAGEGRKLVIADYSQVEARALLWLADDDEMCKLLTDPKANLYQLTAYKMGWCAKDDDIKHNNASKYQMAKQCVLGLGYSMSTFTFALRLEACGIDLESVPRNEWTDVDIERISFVCEKQAFLDIKKQEDWHRIGQLIWVQRIVEAWRDANWRIAGRRNEETGFREGGFWREQQRVLVNAAVAKTPRFWFTMPSGRRKVYYDPVVCTDNKDFKSGGRIGKYYMARPIQGGRATVLNGGKLTENTVQAFCRDILVNAIVEISDKHPNWQYLFNVYDEVVFSVPEKEAEGALAEISYIMCHGDNIKLWTEGLPLGVEGCISDHYTK